MDEFDIPRVQIVRRKKLRDDDSAIEQDQENTGCERKPVTPEFPPHQLTLRREMNFRLRIRHLLDGIRIERRIRDEMGKRRARRRKHGAHFLCPLATGYAGPEPPARCRI